MTDLFDPILSQLTDKDRAIVLSALAAVEHSSEPVSESVVAGLRDATLRECVAELLHLIGRTLVQVDQYMWTSGYRDDIAAAVYASESTLPATDRAVLVLILIHSVAIPRAEGRLSSDSWVSTVVTPISELRQRSQVAVGDLKDALARLRAAGLVKQARARGVAGQQESGYVPGPQLYRLTPAARRRLQDELILAAGPSTPLAAAVRARRGITEGNS